MIYLNRVERTVKWRELIVEELSDANRLGCAKDLRLA